MALLQRSYKVCICLSLQQRLENSRTTPPMPHLVVQEKPLFFPIASIHAMYMSFFYKYFLKHVTNESEVKEPSLSSILLYIDDRKPTKSRNLSRFKFQVKLLALLLFGMEQHKTSSPTGSMDPPACFQIIKKGLVYFGKGHYHHMQGR